VVRGIRVTLPKGLADHFRASERLVSAPHGGRDYGSRREIVRRLVEAIDGRQTIAARYRSRRTRGRNGAERKLDPYHLRVAEEGIYLMAHCHRSGEVKTFLVDRFDEVRPTGELFTPPNASPPNDCSAQLRDVGRPIAEGELHRRGRCRGPLDGT
jgi:predicted DNA-binding transcriptional regulator YafY